MLRWLHIVFLFSAVPAFAARECPLPFRAYVIAPDLNDRGERIIREDVFTLREWSEQEQWDRVLVPRKIFEAEARSLSQPEFVFTVSHAKAAALENREVLRISTLAPADKRFTEDFVIDTSEMKESYFRLHPSAKVLLIQVRDNDQVICVKRVPIVIHQ